MSIEILKSNLMQTRKIIEELAILNHEAANVQGKEKEFLDSAINSFLRQLYIINNSIPNLISGIAAKKQVASEETVAVQISAGTILLNKDDRKKFIDELKISEVVLKKLRKEKKARKTVAEEEFKKPSAYVAIASRFFSKYSFKLADYEVFKHLNERLRKANMPYLLSTYISVMLFSSFLIFLISFLIAISLSFFSITMVVGKAYPIFSFLGMAGLGFRLLKNSFFSIGISALTFWFLYAYPSSQAASISNKIRSELPFAVIQMSSIAGSGVEPSKIFSILVTSTEYPAISHEIKKIINYINLYGYDLINALKNTAKTTSSQELAELLNSMATNISGGGSISDYLNKKAEDMLLDYKLERKKYSSIAETSMDIYIGILIAAPLIFMVLLVIMNVTGMSLGMSIQTLSYLIVAGIALLNIGFLIFLQFRQPA